MLLLSGFTLKAQDYYLTTVNVDNTASDTGLHIVADEEGYFVFCGAEKFCYVRTDLNGNKVWNHVLNYPINASGVTDLLKLPNDNYLLIGTLNQLSMSSQDLFIFAEEDGDAYQEVIHGDEMDNRAANAILRGNNIIAYTSFAPPGSSPTRNLLLTMDSTGILLHRDTLPNVVGYYSNLSANITLLPSDEYVIGIGAQDSITLKISGYLRKIDTMGNTIWEKRISDFSSTSPNVPIHLATLKNGNFVVSWLEYPYEHPDSLAAYFVRCYNAAGDSLWQYTFINIGYGKNIQGLRVCANGDIIGVGYIPYHPLTGTPTGWMFRLSPSGQLLWQREYIYWDALAQVMLLYDLVEDPYGDIVATGFASRPDPDDGIWKGQAVLLKVDSMGCFGADGCNDTTIVHSVVSSTSPPPRAAPAQAVRLLPAGAGEYWALAPELYQATQLLIYDLNGRLVMEQPLSVGEALSRVAFPASLPQGMYVYVAEQGGLAVARGKVVHTW